MNSGVDVSAKLKSEAADSETVFPWSLAEEVFSLLQENQIRTIRYCDIDWTEAWFGSRFRYLDEYVRFRTGGRNPWSFVKAIALLIGTRAGGNGVRSWVRQISDRLDDPTLILQHDADLLPDKTCLMLEKEAEVGLRSSAYVFSEHATDASYQLDTERFQKLEAMGFEIGYHQNAYERSDYDPKVGLQLADKDIGYLRKFFRIRTFVPHGGDPASDGRNNEHLPHEGELRPLLWAYNGKCILKDATWTDGGIRKRCPSDPRDFVRGLIRGSRAMMLMHPQYYGERLRDDWELLPIAKQQWWRELWGIE